MATLLLPSVPAGENPYTVYLAVIHSLAFNNVPPPSLVDRIIILYVIAGVGLVGALIHLYLLLLDAKRRNGLASVWLFRVVRCTGGAYIVTNSKLTSSLLSVMCLTLCVGYLHNLQFSVIELGDAQRLSGGWRSLLAAPILLHALLLTWGQQQAFRVRGDGFLHKSVLSAPVVNGLFLATTILFVGALLTTGIIVTQASWELWDNYLVLRSALESLEATWTGGPVDIFAVAPLLPWLSRIVALSERSSQAYLVEYSVGSFACFICLATNIGSVFLVRRVLQEAHDRFANAPVDLEAAAPVPTVVNFSARESISGASSAFGKAESISAEKPLMDLSSHEMRAIAGKAAHGLRGEQAKQMLAVRQAGRDCIKMACWLSGMSVIATSVSLWYNIHVLAAEGWLHDGWGAQEAALTAIPWIYCPILLIVFPALIIATYKGLPPVQDDCAFRQVLVALHIVKRRQHVAPSGRVRVLITEHVEEDFKLDNGVAPQMLETIIEGGRTYEGGAAPPAIDEPAVLSEGDAIRQVAWRKPAWADMVEEPAVAVTRDSGVTESSRWEDGGAAPVLSTTLADDVIPWEWRFGPPTKAKR